MAVAEGIDFLVLDHISIIVSGLDDHSDGGERKLIDKLMTKLRSLVEETKIGVLAIVHLKRPSGSRKSFNEGGTVSLTDLRGSGSLEQLSDVVIAMERDQQVEEEERKNESRLRVLKNRGVGLTGPADTLIYNEETGRLYVKGQEPFMKAVDNDDF
jgi:twinkle protein